MFPRLALQVHPAFMSKKCFRDVSNKCFLDFYLQLVFHRRLQHVPPRLLQYVFRPLTLSELTFAFFSHMFPELQQHSQGREPSSHHQTRKPSRSDTTADPNKSMSIERCLATEPDAFVRRVRQHAVLGQYRGSAGRRGGWGG